MIFEAEFAAGLLPIVKAELIVCIGNDGHLMKSFREDSIQFQFEGDLDRLKALRTVIAIYSIVQFDVPRPKALLGHEHFHHLMDNIHETLSIDDYQSLYVSAAGSDSSVMMRIKAEISQHLGLSVSEKEGDLLLRVRRIAKAKQGWEVLFRITPRPLATRDWRICNYEGALNGSIAAALVKLSNPTPEDHFLNIACGSGTIAIERALDSPAASITGCDISGYALACATQNAMAAHINSITWMKTDAIQMPIAANSVSKLVVDLPFGQLTGSHDENEWLYPAIISEAGRIATDDARLVVISHEMRLMESVILQSDEWQLVEEPQKIIQSGLHPRIYILERL
ncbi:MAG: methyltransferase [Phototrophicaceae bacterium]